METTPWVFPDEKMSMDGEHIFKQIGSAEHKTSKQGSQEHPEQVEMRKERISAPSPIRVSQSDTTCLAEDEALKSDFTLSL